MYMKRLFLTALLCAFGALTAFAQSDLQPAAIVNLSRSEPITVKQLRTEVELRERSAGRPLTTEERRQILDVMINERLAIQAAERDRVAVSENEINQQLQQLRTGMVQAIGRQPTDAEFAAAVQNETGLELPAFREQLRRQIIIQKYLQSKKQNVLESLRVPTEEDIQEAFNLARSNFVRPDTVRFSMIQVNYGPDAASKTRARELADRLFREINSDPAKFDEVVLRAQAPNSGYQAGDGGFLPRNMEAREIVGADFINTAFALRQGEVSRLLEGRVGYQIIKITETYAMKNLELDDVYQLGTRITVRDFIGNSLLQQRQGEVLAQASQELVTELRAGNTFQVFEQNLAW
jgi:parvulin-like peptidyl-prolyl isomerase